MENHETERHDNEDKIERLHRQQHRCRRGRQADMNFPIDKIRTRSGVAGLTSFQNMKGMNLRTVIRGGENVVNPMA